MVKRFGLSGDSAEAVRTAFAAPASGTSVTIAGILLVVFSALSFSRTLQRVFELTWNLSRRGMRGTMAGLRWLAVVVIYFALHPALGGALHGLIGLVASLSGTFVLWLLTPYLLLDGRVPWRRLVPQAALCAVGVTVLGLGCAIYVPHAMSTSAEEFGAIGVAFTLLSVLWAGGFVVVGAAAIGSLDWRPSSSPGDAPTLTTVPETATEP